MSRRNRSSAVVSATIRVTSTAAQSSSLASLADEVIRRACRGDRVAIGRLAGLMGPRMVEHAADHMGRFDADAEDVSQEVFVAMLDGKLGAPKADESPVEWLLSVVETFARHERARAARRWGKQNPVRWD